MAPVGAVSPPQEIVLYNGRWWRHRHLLILNLMLVVPLVSSYSAGFDGSMMNGLQSVVQWKEYFGHPTPKQLGLLNAGYSIGSLCVIPLAPYALDKFGRCAGIFGGACIALTGAIVQALSRNMTMFIVARMLVGFGTMLEAMASPLLISELAYPTHRAPLTALYNCLWFSGSIVAGWTTFGTFRIPNDWSWRIPSALQGISSLTQCMFVWLIPDSPRWLMSVGRDQEALEVLKKWHAGGGENNALVHFEYNEIKQAIKLEAELDRSGWLDLFRTPGNRRRMRIIIAIAVFSQLSGNGLIGRYLAPVLNGIDIVKSRDQTLINACIAVSNLFFAVSASMSIDRFGRRKLFLASNIGMLVSLAILTTCAGIYQTTKNTRAARGVLAMMFVHRASYAIGYTPLVISYSVEILPFFLRAKGLAMVYLAVMSALLFSQYTDPIAIAALKYKYYLIFTVWLIFELVFIYFFVVETKNRSLEETAALFDGDVVLPELETGPRSRDAIVDRASLHSSKASLPSTPMPRLFEGMTGKPRMFDGREGFQLYELRGKRGSQSHRSL
ncbi:hypothetical protein FRC08_002014 [Ceratobasidium sp. 394]|nr:hypothetical protein FRC08_002014 [Ceratobasidium sp. 394]KAG9099119.1 hypothetical protein FS749_002079 [Ceratobasidium sp. UAMH 11750]